MSYARFSAGSDVYVFAHSQGFVQCCGCLLEDQSVDLHGAEEVVLHMRDHQAAGHTVPEHLFSVATYDDSDFQPYDRSK